jgi:putative membrane protein
MAFSREPLVLLVVLAAAYAASAWRPFDAATWWMEVIPVFLALPVVLAVHVRVGLTSMALRLLALEALVVALGAHYTYARVPLGFWAAELLDLPRNHYDRFAHLMQGVAPTLAMRELLLRCTPLQRGGWLFWIVVSICLAMSASYELVEWAAAIVFGDGAVEFLGTQGDPWDTQWDMFLALVGCVWTQLLAAGAHDRQIRSLVEERRRTPQSSKRAD